MINQQKSFFNQNINKIILIGSVLIFAVNLFLRFHIIHFHSVEIGGIEINVIDGIIKILSGKFLYDDPSQPPYDIMQYSPLYYYLVAGIAKLFNISQNDPQNIYELSRSVAIAFNILNIYAVYLIARQFLLSKGSSLLAGIFSFIILTQHYYSRGDSLYCFLFFIAVYYFFKYLNSRNDLFLIINVIVSFLCIMTKQSGIIIAGSIFLFFVLKKDFRRIIIMVFTFLFLAILFYLLSGYIGGMKAFYGNVVLGVKNGLSLDMLRSFIHDRYFLEAGLWIVIGFYLSSFVIKKNIEEKYFFLLFLLLLSLLFAFITGFKNGSSLNYFVECFILTFLAGLIYIKNNEKKFFQFGLMAFFILTILLKTSELFSAVYISKFRHDDVENYQTEKQVADFMLTDLKIKSNDLVFLNFRGYTELFLSGHSILNQKDIGFFINLYASKDIDYSFLLKQADHGFIKYIIGDSPLSAIDILGRHFINFKPLKTFGDITVYEYSGL